MQTPSSTGLSTMPTALSCGGTRCAAANRIRLGMKRINQINNLQHLSTLLTQFTNRPPRSLETIIMTRVLALADQSKIGCITQRRLAKVGAKTHPQRGAALDRNGLSVSTETACRFEPKSPVGNSEICTVTVATFKPMAKILKHFASGEKPAKAEKKHHKP